MAHTEQDDFQLYFSRIRPIFHQLFNLAHAITGSSEQAEYCLQYAMLDCWAAGDASASRHGFREGLRASAMRTALRIANTEDVEYDWNGLASQEGESDPLLNLIAQEPAELRRVLVLRYGCNLSPRRIARLISADATRVQTLLRRFEARIRHKLTAWDRRRTDAQLTQAIRSHLTQPSPLSPEMNSVFRTFQADAATISRPSRLPARILRSALAVILAILCIAAFWLAAVLMQPAVMEENSVQVSMIGFSLLLE